MKYFQKLFMCFVCHSLCYGYLSAFRTGGISFSRKICSHSSLLKKIVPLSLQDCHKACKLRDDCKSISYNRSFKDCELHSTTNSDPAVLIVAKGWVYMEKDDTDADIGHWVTPGERDRGICSHPEDDGTVVWKEAYLKKADDFVYVNESIANISDLIFTNGSQLHFTCTSDLYMFRSPVKHCFNETWSSVPQCFALRLGKFCSDAKDCDVPEIPHSSGMNCSNNICDCPLGYGYSYSEFRCFERCPNDDFANTFRKSEGVVLQGFNELIVSNVNKDMCMQFCLNETSFVCRSFDYIIFSSCRLQSVVVADEPDSIRYYYGSYYQRDCL